MASKKIKRSVRVNPHFVMWGETEEWLLVWWAWDGILRRILQTLHPFRFRPRGRIAINSHGENRRSDLYCPDCFPAAHTEAVGSAEAD